jgi:hypothetical protein
LSSNVVIQSNAAASSPYGVILNGAVFQAHGVILNVAAFTGEVKDLPLHCPIG